MAPTDRHGKLPDRTVSDIRYAFIHIEHDADFASIKIARGTKAKSYQRDGMLVGEDADGHALEVVLLNLSDVLRSSTRMSGLSSIFKLASMSVAGLNESSPALRTFAAGNTRLLLIKALRCLTPSS